MIQLTLREALSETEWQTHADLAEKTGMSVYAIKKRLRDRVDDGSVTRVDRDGQAYYRKVGR